jgi:hypothetical protein
MTNHEPVEGRVHLKGVRAINVSYYNANINMLHLDAVTPNGEVVLLLIDIDPDLARNLLNALAAPNTPIRHGHDGETVSQFGDWAIAETIINNLTDE